VGPVWVNYGTSPDALNRTAYDDRGEATQDDTHHVTVSGLDENTTCYFELVYESSTHNDDGVPYQVTTGPTLDVAMPDMISGAAYQSDETTPAQGVIVYSRIGTASSQWMSSIVGSNGYWAMDIAPARTADLQNRYPYDDETGIIIEAQGAGYGQAGVTSTVVTARDGAPDLRACYTAHIPLVMGWNLIALPTMPVTGYTASTMADAINAQGGNVTQVFWWNGPAGSWDFWLVDIGYGTDFNIEVGEGYLLNSGTGATWAIAGFGEVGWPPGGPGE